MALFGPDRFERAHGVLAVGVIAATALAGSLVFAASVALGVVIEALNFRVLRRGTRRLFAGELDAGRGWNGLFTVRFLLLGLAMYLALDAGAHPIGLVLGLSLIVPAVVIVALRTEYPAAPAGDVPPPDDPSWDEWNPWLARERTSEREGAQ